MSYFRPDGISYDFRGYVPFQEMEEFQAWLKDNGTRKGGGIEEKLYRLEYGSGTDWNNWNDPEKRFRMCPVHITTRDQTFATALRLRWVIETA